MKCKMAAFFSLDSMFKKVLILIVLLSLVVPFVCNFSTINYSHIASHFGKNKIKSTGSTSMSHILSILSDDFMSVYPGFVYEKSETGSGSAPFLVSSGEADLGDMSRYMRDDERTDSMKSKLIALDGIVVILNKNNKISDLSLENLRDIFSKKVTDWSEISDEFSGKIVSVGREEASGTREGFENGINLEKSRYDIILPESGDIAAKVSSDEKAVGYISMASIAGNIHAVKVNNIECSSENVRNENYPLIRPFVQVYSENSNKNNYALEKWIEYLDSDRARKLIEGEKLINA